MYPAMINIEGKSVTIIGGGQIAYRKATTFLKFGAKVRVISPLLSERFERIKDQVEWINDCYHPKYLDGQLIVVGATNNQSINQTIGEMCRERQQLCNLIDNPGLSSFIVPAHIKRGDLVISISTNGKSPLLAKQIKEQLENQFDESYSERLALLGVLRKCILKEEESERKQLLEGITEMTLEELREYSRQYVDSDGLYVQTDV